MNSTEQQDATILWREGYQSWRKSPPDLQSDYQPVIEAIKGKLADCHSMIALIARYREDNDWCLEIARQIQPEKPWCWRLSVVEDAAYHLRAQEVK